MEESKKQWLADYLWESKYSLFLMLIVAVVTIFAMLGAKELWTQEWRWADIAHTMMIRHDLLHPYLAGHDYYDKPLLSYWLIIVMRNLFHTLSLWAIRLPSAIAGFLTVICTYEIGKTLTSKRMGLIVAWMLMSTGYFIFWARTGNTDMLNIAGIMLAILWYFKRRHHPGFITYLIFFVIISIASLMKGLIAPAVIGVALLPDLLYNYQWKKHVRPSLFIALLIGLIIYFIPFALSHFINPTHYKESGLWLVFRENILRYVQPFDHEGPWYLYFEFLPLATAPWILFTIPALITFPGRWHQMTLNARWYFWSFILIFLFFTFSGSRRNYYIIPMIPFALLFTAEWIESFAEKRNQIYRWIGIVAFLSSLMVVLIYVIAMPIYYLNGGPKAFEANVKTVATKIRPWEKWQVQVLSTDNNMTYYFRSHHPVFSNKTSPEMMKQPTFEKLANVFPVLKSQDRNTIIILGKEYFPFIKDQMKNYKIIHLKPTLGNRIFNNLPDDSPIAMIPNN